MTTTTLASFTPPMPAIAAQVTGIADDLTILGKLIEASGMTLLLTVLAMPLAVLTGLVLAQMRRSKNPLFSWAAVAYIEILRGTPLLVQLFLIYYTLPQLDRWFGTVENLGMTLFTWNGFWVGVFCLAANYAAYQAEIIRAGIESVDPGQREAALSIGMSERQAFYWVVMPQAFRVAVPPIINDAIAMLKDSCLVSVISVQELLLVAQSIGKAQLELPKLLVMAAVIYLILSLVVAAIGRVLERKLRLTTDDDAANKLAKFSQPHGH